MSLRTKLLLALIVLLTLVVGGTDFLRAVQARRMFVRHARQQAAALVQMVAAADAFAIQAARKTDELVGSMMVAQATLATHLVDVAENHSDLTNRDITARLKDITRETIVDEFWITDEEGHAYLRTRDDIDFTFPEHPTGRGQAYEFRKLLSGHRGQVQQRMMRRDHDGRYFKYAGVSGIDRPRIVQVGFEARSLRTFRQGATPRDLAQLLTDRAGAMSLAVVDEDGRTARGPRQEAPTDDSATPPAQLLPTIRQAIEQRETVTSIKGDTLYVVTPRPYTPRPSAFVVAFDAREMNAAFRHGWMWTGTTSGVVLALGSFMAIGVSRRISRPLEHVASEAKEIGKGDLKRRIDVKAGGEVKLLADSFNDMVASLGSHVAQLQQTTAAKERLESELRIAASVQRAILPTTDPNCPGVRISASMQPARVVGGDLYDMIELPDGRLGFAIGDVCGKGIAAALFASESLSAIRALTVETRDAGRALAQGNRVLRSTARTAGLFVTLFLAVYDPARRVVSYANSGHPSPILLRPGQPLEQLYERGSLPLGVMDESAPAEGEAQLRNGDTLVLYTDGVTEAANSKGEMFGLERLQDCLARCGELQPDATVQAVTAAVAKFVGGEELADDLTVLALRFGD